MKKSLLLIPIGLLISLGAVFFYFSQRGYVVRLTEAQLQEKLSEKLPVTEQIALFEIIIDNPTVDLVKDTERITASFDILMNIGLSAISQPLTGSIQISGGIDYSTDTGQIFLTDPAIESINLEGIPSQYTTPISDILAQVMPEYLADVPIHTLAGETSQDKITRFIIKDIEIDNETLAIRLGI